MGWTALATTFMFDRPLSRKLILLVSYKYVSIVLSLCQQNFREYQSLCPLHNFLRFRRRHSARANSTPGCHNGLCQYAIEWEPSPFPAHRLQVMIASLLRRRTASLSPVSARSSVRHPIEQLLGFIFYYFLLMSKTASTYVEKDHSTLSKP
jgi:hypothetical protein